MAPPKITDTTTRNQRPRSLFVPDMFLSCDGAATDSINSATEICGNQSAPIGNSGIRAYGSINVTTSKHRNAIPPRKYPGRCAMYSAGRIGIPAARNTPYSKTGAKHATYIRRASIRIQPTTVNTTAVNDTMPSSCRIEKRLSTFTWSFPDCVSTQSAHRTRSTPLGNKPTHEKVDFVLPAFALRKPHRPYYPGTTPLTVRSHRPPRGPNHARRPPPVFGPIVRHRRRRTCRNGITRRGIRREGKTIATARSGIDRAAAGRGTHVAQIFAAQPDVQVRYVSDVDSERLKKAQTEFGLDTGHAVADLRKLLDDDLVDAVLVATPNHWHAPAAILACDAGKHVYVEKPCSHNIREGRLLVEAARRNHCHVQHGTQVRSTSTIRAAVDLLREGRIGDVLVCRAWNIQRRSAIGHAAPTEPPAGFDYDTWVGPAPMVPFQANCHHSTWNWFYHFGTGDMGNDGVHDVDYARWGLGVTTHPTQISAAGGKYFFDDDQQFPDTQQVTFTYPDTDGSPRAKTFIYEQRLWSTNYPHNCDSGVEFYGTEGQLFVSRRGKLQLLGNRNERLDVDAPLESQNAEAHVANFLAAIRGEQPLNAEIEVGHLSSSLCHLGNLATRLGRSLRFDPDAEQILDDPEANALVRRSYREHWATPQRA